MDIAILADDLTGACDTAVPFLRSSLPAQVSLSLHPPLPISGILAMDTNSRDVDSVTAACRVTAAITALQGDPPHYWYSKIDSMLRGSVASEIRTVMQATNADLVLLAPAFPAQFRFTVNGCQFLHQRPVTGQHSTSHLPSILSAASLPSILCSLMEIRHSPGCLATLLTASLSGTVIICDAVTDADLDVIAQTALASHRHLLWCGTGGLAAAFARQYYGIAPILLPPPLTDAPVLTVVGSLHPITREQLTALHASAGLPVVWVNGNLLERDTHTEHDRVIAALLRWLTADQSVCLATSPVRAAATIVTRSLGTIVAHTLQQFPLQRLIITGGEVSRAVCQHLGVTLLQLVGEVVPGVPVSLTINGYPDLYLITKSGGFGQSDTLFRAYQYLRGLSPLPISPSTTILPEDVRAPSLLEAARCLQQMHLERPPH